MRITIVLAIFAISFTIFATHCDFAFAQTSSPSAIIPTDEVDLKDLTLDEGGAVEIGTSLIAPNSPLYFLKAIREKIEIILIDKKETKAIQEVEFAQRRLREMNALIKNKKQDLIPPTLERYKGYLQEAANLSSNDEELQIRVGEAISRHLDVLQRVYDAVGNPTAKAAVRAAIEKAEEHNRLLIEKLNLASQQELIKKVALRQALACKFFEREASSSALNSTEREYMRQKVNVCKKEIKGNLKDELRDIKQKRMGKP